MGQPKRLPSRSTPKSDLKHRLTKDGALNKKTEESHRRRYQRRGSLPRSGQYYLPIDLNHPDFLYDAIWEITRDKIALEEERAAGGVVRLRLSSVLFGAFCIAGAIFVVDRKDY